MNKPHLFTRPLLAWYRENGRRLPWRETYHPYPVWISEIMLQQTQVETVIPYFRKFLEAFPTLSSLAAAPMDRVLKQWEGLGYYSRARNLARSAAIIVHEHRGRFPERFDDLVALPGIGRSTAGAILSLAFGQSYPILDGNVRRVLSRYYAIESYPGPSLTRLLWDHSGRLISRSDPRNFNSALMDLGATICKPREPLCPQCPVRSSCTGFQKNLQSALPLKSGKRGLPLRIYSSWVISKRDAVLIRRRNEEGLLGGLWEFPGRLMSERPSPRGESLFGNEKEIPGIRMTVEGLFLKLHQTFTHFKMERHVYKARFHSGRVSNRQEMRWVPICDLDRYPFSATDKKIAAALRDPSVPAAVSENHSSLPCNQ